MTLAVDSQEASNAGHRAAGAATLTWSFTNVAGNVLLVAAVVTQDSTATGSPTISGVTYAGVAMSPVVDVGWDTSSRSHLYLFVLANPAKGANNVVVTGTNATAASYAIDAGAQSYSGGDTGTPTGQTSSTFSSSVTNTHAQAGALTVPSGNYVFGAGGWGGGSGAAPVQDSGFTKTFGLNGTVLTAGDNINANYAASTGAALNAGFTWSGSDEYGMVGVEVRAGAPAIAAFIPHRMPLGV